jgi:hypothetical protein
MDTGKRFAFKAAYRLVLIALCLTGLYFNFFGGKNGMMNLHPLIYYTLQSNLLVLLVTLLTLVLSAKDMDSGSPRQRRWLHVLRFATAPAITLTFLVFWTLLSRIVGADYLLSPNNLCVHTLVPLMYVLDFFLFDRETVISRPQVLWSAAMPVYYMVFAVARAEIIQEKLYTGSRYPYFFIDLDTYGWLGNSAGMGVLWWVLILLALVIGIGAMYRMLHTSLQKKRAETPSDK